MKQAERISVTPEDDVIKCIEKDCMEASKMGRRWTTSMCPYVSGNVNEVHLDLKQNGYVVEEIKVCKGVFLARIRW